MEGDRMVTEMLNELLGYKLTSANQYSLQAMLCHIQGYEPLHDALQKYADDEMKHVGQLMTRILNLGGCGMIYKPGDVQVGATLDEQIKTDTALEYKIKKAYCDCIIHALEVGDTDTAHLLCTTLPDTEKHIDWMDALSEQNSALKLQECLTHSDHNT